MNRKEFIKSLTGLFVVGAAAPAIAKGLDDRRYRPTAVPTPGIPSTPPPDLRTLDEVWEDHVNQYVKQVENTLQYQSPHYKYVTGIDRIAYDRVKAMAPSKGWNIVEKVRDGVTTFEIDGCLFRLY